MEEARYPLLPLVNGWVEKLKAARKDKKAKFQDDADEAMTFFHCGKELAEHMWKDSGGADGPFGDGEQMPAPKFRVVIGKVTEVVSMFGPSMYHKNPTVTVEPKALSVEPELLMQTLPQELIQQAVLAAQQQNQPFTPESLFPPSQEEIESKITAKVLQYILDFIQRETDKKVHSRRACDEALIKGRGVLYTRPHRKYADGPLMPETSYISVDQVLIDPDVDLPEDVQWMSIEHEIPAWEFAEMWGLPKSYVKKRYGTRESVNSQAESSSDEEASEKRRRGESNDLVRYWEIFSKMGMGHKLSGLKDFEKKDTKKFLDEFGDYCYIVVAEKIPFPVNLRTKDMQALFDEKDEDKQGEKFDKMYESVSWPIPFWKADAWPLTFIDFREVPNSAWPMPYIKPAMGHLKFINWVMTFLCNRLRTTSKTVISAMKALPEEIVDKLMSGRDLEVLQIPANLIPDGDVKKAVHAFQFPDVKADTWKIVEAEMEFFEEASGLSELAYGQSGGMRTAAEANFKQGNFSIRPDDMANKLDDAMSRVAHKEAMALHWINDAEDLVPILGKQGAALYERFVKSRKFEDIACAYHFSVQAGSSRKPNKDTQIQQINDAIRVWAPIIQFAMQAGQVQIPNFFMKKWGEVNEFDMKGAFLPKPPPQPENPEAMKAQAELELAKAEHQLKREEMGMKLEMQREKMKIDAQKAQQDIAISKQKADVDMQVAQMKGRTEMMKATMGIQADQAQAQSQMQMQREQMGMEQQMNQQEMQHKQAGMQMDVAQRQQGMEIERQSGQQKMGLEKQKATEGIKTQRMQTQAGIKNQAAQAKAKQQAMKQGAKKPAKSAKPKGKKK